MSGKYVGPVPRQDPVYDFLRKILIERMGSNVRHPEFRAFQLVASNEVYRYEERLSGTQVIGKFFGPRFGWDRDVAASTARQEYESLEKLRAYDLVGSPHHVIRPLGFDRDINCVLALEYYPGEQFSDAIGRSIYRHDDAHLFWRLKALAFFLATQHGKTVSRSEVDFDADCRYLDQVVDRLRDRHRIGQWDVDEFSWLRECWRSRPRMWRDNQVWLHGDATPANFLFGDGLDVAAIDLERMKRGDRMFDVGRIAGELQHAFMVGAGNRYRAEPFIGHFFWEYSSHFADRHRVFKAITDRAPYYMGLNLLRIARNNYLTDDYSGQLVAQAKELLRAC